MMKKHMSHSGSKTRFQNSNTVWTHLPRAIYYTGQMGVRQAGAGNISYGVDH